MSKSNIKNVPNPRFCLICGEAVLSERDRDLRDLKDSPTKAIKIGENVFPGCEGSLVLNERLRIYFTISKLLKLTEEQCVKLIPSGGSITQLPSQEGTQLCASCDSVVNEAINYHLKVLELKGKIDELGVALREKLETSAGGGLGRWGNVLGKRGGGPINSAQIDAEKIDNTDATRIVKIEVDPNDVHLTSSDTELPYQDEPHNYPFEANPLSTKMSRKKQNRVNRDKCSERSDSDSDYEPSEPSKSRKILKWPTGADHVLKTQKHHCKYCQSIYGTKHGFRQHLKIHTESRKLGNKFDCPKCGHPNLSEETLRRHLSKFHETMRNTCKICGHVAHRRGLHEKHMLSKHNITIWSPISDGQVSNEGTTDMIGTNRYGEDVNFATDDTISEVGGIPQSEEKQEQSSVKSDSPETVKPQGQTINTKSDSNSCEQCKIAFNCLRTYQRHKAEHRTSEAINHKYDCSECGFPNSSEKRLQYHKRIAHHTESRNLKSRTNMNKNSYVNAREKRRRSKKHINVEGDDDDSNCYVSTEESKTPVYEKREAYDSDLQRTSASTTSALYSCEKCQIVYKSLRSYQRHAAEHRASEEINHKYDCNECGFPNSSGRRLLRHKRYVHQEVTKLTCKICGHHVLRPIQLRMHMRRHNPSWQTKKVGRPNRYLENIRTDGKLACLICKAYYSSTESLARHMGEHEKSKAVNGKFDCDICSFPTSSEHRLRLHKNSKHGKTLPTCKLCNKTFARPNILRIHMNLHTEYDKTFNPVSGKYSCQFCDASFRTARGIQTHQLGKHKDELQTPMSALCSQCGKRFCTDVALRKHIRRIHENENVFKFSCDICGKGFDNKTSFSTHQQKHGEIRFKRFVCEVCGVAYLNNRTLQDHTARFHPDPLKPDEQNTCEKPGQHRCKWCNEVFPFRYILIRHTQTHKELYNFDCNECGKSYISRSSLRLHIEISHSSGRNKFSCEFCGKVFLHKHYVICHYRFCRSKKQSIN